MKQHSRGEKTTKHDIGFLRYVVRGGIINLKIEGRKLLLLYLNIPEPVITLFLLKLLLSRASVRLM
jgi:hypothetical protein